MKIEQSKVACIKLTELDRLDPITVFLEDFEPGRGKITIETSGKSWSSFWPAMGGTISEFFTGCGNGYLISHLSGVSSTIMAEGEALQNDAKARILKMRRKKEISQGEALDLFQTAENIETHDDSNSFIDKVYGDDWYYEAPDMPNPKYLYLSEIVDAVKAGLAEINKAEAA